MREDDNQKKFKEELKKWLKLNSIDRTEFATRCHVSYYTFNNWMSTSSIPLPKIDIIRNLMQEYGQNRPAKHDENEENEPGMQSFTLHVSREDYHLFVAAALKCNLTVEQWAETMLVWDAQNRMNISRESILLAEFNEEIPEEGLNTVTERKNILTAPNPYEGMGKLAEDATDGNQQSTAPEQT